MKKEDGTLEILPFYLVAENIERKVIEIQEALNTVRPPIMFLTGPTNFRDEVAKKKGYKANRDKDDKPYHIDNARAYLKGRFNSYESVGCEADDLLCIAQMEAFGENLEKCSEELATTVIVTRDKDLRQCMGWHYGWECGGQPEYKLRWVDELGDLTATFIEGVSEKTGKPTRRFNKLEGTGLKWFYAQMLTGDSVDNIPGLKGVGGGKAYDYLHPLESEQELLDICIREYRRVYGDMWEVEMMEQAHLVYMLRERNEDGSLKWWEIPNGD
jgi:5'-3' exonuclease